ncbi:hypothetical protein Q9L58_010345 [Maublancomyces gigas]|uniref:Gag protein n=1 Tax=Discina gigas TaxID=1032678 RepID=A0ABR3G5B8_9PEZI
MSSTQEHIPSLTVKLASKGDYADWLDAAEAMLNYYKILEVVQATEKRPTDNMKGWDKKNKWARAFLIQHVGSEVHREMPKFRISSEMWKPLEDLFDRKTTSTLHEMVGNLMTLRYTPKISLNDHLTSFAN